MKPNEKSAKGVKGFLLKNFFTGKYFFRVYNPDKTFTDYDITAEEVEVELISGFNSLYVEEKGENRLDIASKVLEIQPGETVVRVHRKDGKRFQVEGHYDENKKFIPHDAPKEIE